MDDLEINDLIECWELTIKQKMTDGTFQNIFYQAKIKWFNNEYFEGEIIHQQSNASFKVQSGYASNGPFMGVISFEVISDDGSVRSFQGNIVDEFSIWGHCSLNDGKQVNGIIDGWNAFRIGKLGEGIIDINEAITIFEVDSDGTIRYSDFYETKTRADAYDMSLEHDVSNPGELVSFAERCPPLQWLIGEHYTEYRNDPAYPDRLKSMPEEPDNGWTDWVQRIDKKTFSSLRKGIKKWLSEEPRWDLELDFIDYSKQNEGAVFDFFQDEENDLLDALGVRLIDGPYPGSNYCGAELLCSIEKANAVARINGLDYRFRKKTEEELNEAAT